MNVKFSEIVDIPKLQTLMEAFYKITSIPSGIIDVDGNILVAVGWQEICTEFHRKNPQTELLCRQSDCYIKNNLDLKQPYIWYKCANGLIDAATPIIVDGVHLANFFRGQFLFEEPDFNEFRQRAKKYGFDERRYINALKKVPIYSKEKLDSIMDFIRQLAENLAHSGMNKLRLIDSQAETFRDLRDKFKAILENTPNIAVRIFGQDGDIRYINKTAEDLYDWSFEEVKGKNIYKLDCDPRNVTFMKTIIEEAEEKQCSVGPVEWNVKNRGGIEKYLYTTVFPLNINNEKEFICMDVDISERKQIEREIARFEKLHLVGEMAASLGHEVRNPITTVRGFLQIYAEKEQCEKSKDYYELMIDELDRANSIITEFLTLAKNKAIKLELKDLNYIILTLAPLIEANLLTLNQNINLDLGKIPTLMLDEQEIRQLLLNLVRNSMDAMDSGGCLTIKTYSDTNEAVLLIRDQGHGIPQDLLDKVGSPFFSTKENGTGLGLAVCYSIAARHKARITVESTKDGTSFFIRFGLNDGK